MIWPAGGSLFKRARDRATFVPVDMSSDNVYEDTIANVGIFSQVKRGRLGFWARNTQANPRGYSWICATSFVLPVGT